MMKPNLTGMRKKTGVSNCRGDIKSMLFRMSSKFFFRIVRQFNAKQKKAVLYLISILTTCQEDCRTGEQPISNPLQVSYQHMEGVGIHIDEDDAYLTLGFPNGSVKIDQKIRQIFFCL